VSCCRVPCPLSQNICRNPHTLYTLAQGDRHCNLTKRPKAVGGARDPGIPKERNWTCAGFVLLVREKSKLKSDGPRFPAQTKPAGVPVVAHQIAEIGQCTGWKICRRRPLGFRLTSLPDHASESPARFNVTVTVCHRRRPTGGGGVLFFFYFFTAEQVVAVVFPLLSSPWSVLATDTTRCARQARRRSLIQISTRTVPNRSTSAELFNTTPLISKRRQTNESKRIN
jgi:hypothetical protein